MMKNNLNLKLILILIPFVISFTLSMDIYYAVTVQLEDFFSTTRYMVQLTFTVFMVTAGLSQIFIGIFCDKYGRKKSLYYLIIIFILGSILSALSNSIEMLIFSRTIQAFGASGCQLVAFIMIRDCQNDRSMAKSYAYLQSAIALSPIFAPMIGLFFVEYYGEWRLSFYFLAILGFSMLLINYFFIDTYPRTTNKKSNIYMYFSYMKNIEFLIYNLATISGVSAFFMFFSLCPYIVNELELSDSYTALYLSISGFVFFISNIFTAMLVGKIGIYKTTILGLLVLLISSFFMGMIYLLLGLNLFGFLIPSMFFVLGCSMVDGVAMAGALKSCSSDFGKATAFFGVFKWTLSAFFGYIVVIIPVNTTIPISIIVFCFSFFVLFLFKKYIKHD